MSRLKDEIYNTISREQACFKPVSSCIEQINTLRLIVEQFTEFSSDLYLDFVDFENVFDSINRNGIWEGPKIPEE